MADELMENQYNQVICSEPHNWQTADRDLHPAQPGWESWAPTHPVLQRAICELQFCYKLLDFMASPQIPYFSRVNRGPEQGEEALLTGEKSV